MHLPAVNADLIIIAVIVAAALYGMLGGAARLRNLILSTYAGIVLAQSYTAILKSSIGLLSSDQLAIILLIAPIIGFILLHRGHSDKGSGMVNLILGIAAGALLVTAGLRVIAPSTASQIGSDSFIAMELSAFSLWIVGLMPLAAVLPQLLEKSKKRDHHKA